LIRILPSISGRKGRKRFFFSKKKKLTCRFLAIYGCMRFLLLAAIAYWRPPDYDEAYSIFLTAGDPRPAWSEGVLTASAVRGFLSYGYGFAYTGIVARGYALAQFLNLLGVLLMFRAVQDGRRGLALGAGLAFGTASFANYLAVFIAAAVLFWACLAPARRRFLLPAMLGMAPFMALDASYFLAQWRSRAGQFDAFSWPHALFLLVKDAGAALFGGLPLYAGRAGPAVAGALLLLFLAGLGCVIRPAPRIVRFLAWPRSRRHVACWRSACCSTIRRSKSAISASACRFWRCCSPLRCRAPWSCCCWVRKSAQPWGWPWGRPRSSRRRSPRGRSRR
jgi:hypothetical protein